MAQLTPAIDRNRIRSSPHISLDLLAEATGALLSAADPTQWVAGLFPQLAEWMDLDAYCYYQAQEGTDLLVLQTHAGVAPERLSEIERLQLADLLPPTPDRSLTNNNSKRDRDPLLAQVLAAQMYSCHPLLVDHDICGALVFASRQRLCLLPDELNLLRIICHQFAAAVELKRLKCEPTPAADRIALDNERRRLQAVLEVLPVGVFIADHNGQITAVNAAACNIWNCRPVHSPTLEQFAEHYKAYALCSSTLVAFQDRGLFRAVTKGERVCDDEFEIVRHDGRHTILNHAVPIHDAAGTPMGGVSVAVDITDFKRAQRQLLGLNDALEQRVKERTRALLTHQTRLRAMASELTVTEQRERRRLAADLHDYLAQLLVAGKMKTKLVSQMVESRSTRAAIDEIRSLLDESLKYTRTLIADLSPTILYEAGLYAAILWLGERMHRHNLTVTVKQEGEPVDLPDDQAVIVFQTVRELLINVAKHAGVSKAIVRLQRLPAGELAVTVEDKGSGFDTSVATSDDKFGLFSIRERLVALGASFDLQSAPKKGTHAVIRIPLASAESVTETTSPAAPQDVSSLETAEPRADKSVRVLLVDDHKMVREGFRNLIECDPALEVVGEAANGEHAIELARLLAPDVIAMDINMPKMNGIEATRRIKAEMPQVAIIGLSVHDDRGLISSMLEAGATAYLTKGGDFEDLARAIHQAYETVNTSDPTEMECRANLATRSAS